MKNATIIKVLERYAKSLNVMYEEAKATGDVAAEHYRFDRDVMLAASKKIGERKE